MKEISLFLIHLLTAIARLLGRGGVKGIIAQNLLLKQQLIVVCLRVITLFDGVVCKLFEGAVDCFPVGYCKMTEVE